MIKHIYIPNESDRRGAFHVGPMLCGLSQCLDGQYSIHFYEKINLGQGNTWCPKCEERTDLAILATTDLGGEEDPKVPWIPQPPPGEYYK